MRLGGTDVAGWGVSPRLERPESLPSRAGRITHTDRPGRADCVGVGWTLVRSGSHSYSIRLSPPPGGLTG